MGLYRQSRCIEASTIEKIKDILIDASWTNTTVVKGFSRAYTIPLDPNKKQAIIAVRVGTTIHTGVELGSNTTNRKPLILIDLFCSNDGQRLDLKDLLIANLKSGWNYTEYTISGGVTSDATVGNRTVNGKIRVSEISDTPINFDTDKSNLDPHDRFRHLLTLSCEKTLLEV